MGIDIPREMIASHANRGVSAFGESQVIRIEFDVDQIAGAMVERLEKIISGVNVPPSIEVVDPKLVIPETW